MRDFAIATSSPWSIAWLINENDWDHLHIVMHYNCILLGGCNNILIPTSVDGTMWSGFDVFLAQYDPDFIILPPDVPRFIPPKDATTLNPFAVVKWNQVPQIIPENAQGRVSGQAAQVQWDGATQPNSVALDLVAISDPAYPDNSRLAFVVCGDVHASELNPHEFEGETYFYSHGYRERILTRSIRPERQQEVAARIGDDDNLLAAPTREDLAFIIKEENKFPLTGAAKILEACASLQHFVGPLSFVNRTSTDRGRGTRRTKNPFLNTLPGMAVLVSHRFDFHEALLLWNLRANDVLTSWLSFSQVYEETDAIRKWLDSDMAASFYTFGEDITFAASESDQEELRRVFEPLIEQRQRRFPELTMSESDKLLMYDREKPTLQRKHVMITQNGTSCSFLPESALQRRGALALTLEWPTSMLPRKAVLTGLVSNERVQTIPRWSRSKETPEPLDTPRCRITDTHDVRFQFEEDKPIRFVVPAIRQIVQKLLEAAGYNDCRESSHAQYQEEFIKRCGSLLHASVILRNPSFRTLLTLLADNKTQSLPGWILRDPNRRTLNQMEMYERLGKPMPTTTSEYFKVSQSLPEEASKLLNIQLLERGFQLGCRFCSALLWYRAEDVGQNFKCHRCHQDQRLQTNPLWLYKLPEVVFQFFNNDADVALLALFHLLLRSPKNFQYALDSEVFTRSNAKAGNSFDFACLSDGKIYVGEAKSNAVVDHEQFAFYENLALSSAVEGVVFATTEARWNPSVVTRAENLKMKYKGEVILLTRSELLEAARL